MTDLIIGAVDNYEYDQMKMWINSVNRCGFTGRKVLVVYRASDDTIAKIKENGFEVVRASIEGQAVHVQRFAQIAEILYGMEDVERVVFTDVRDVVFQTDPMKWLSVFNRDLVVGAENFKYRDEPWSKNNMLQMFGRDSLNRMLDTPVYCCGVIGGKRDAVADLLWASYMLCKAPILQYGPNGIADQSAMNLVLSLDAFISKTSFQDTNTGFVCHLGTSTHAIREGSGEIGQHFVRGYITEKSVRDNMVCPDPELDELGLVVGQAGSPFSIVHQYDRASKFREAMESKFR